MNGFRAGLLMIASIVACGCVSTPGTRALITPIGVVGIHSFAPTNRQSPDELEAARESEAQLARIAREGVTHDEQR